MLTDQNVWHNKRALELLFFFILFLACAVTQSKRNEKIIRKLFNGLSQEIVMLLEIDKEYTSPNFKFVRLPKIQIFVEIFYANL